MKHAKFDTSSSNYDAGNTRWTVTQDELGLQLDGRFSEHVLTVEGLDGGTWTVEGLPGGDSNIFRALTSDALAATDFYGVGQDGVRVRALRVVLAGLGAAAAPRLDVNSYAGPYTREV